MRDYSVEISPYGCSTESSVCLLQGRNNRLCDKDNSIDVNSFTAWVLNNKREFDLIIDEVKREIKNGYNQVSLRGVILQLNWDKNLCLDYKYADELAYCLCQTNPEFIGKFKKHKPRERKMTASQFMRLISQYLPV